MINLCIDIETTGLLASEHGICSFAAILFNSRFEELDRFYTRVAPVNAVINPKALVVNKFTKDELMSFPQPTTARRDFFYWLDEISGGSTDEQIFALGHNYSFDKGFLTRFLGEARYNKLFYYKARDTFVLAQALKDAGLMPDDQSLSLGGLCEYYGIQEGGHNAINDASATLQLYKELIEEISNDR